MKRIVTALAATLLFIAPAAAKTKSDMSAAEFVNKATIGNVFEVQSSQIALDKSSNSAIKDFAQQMITDHTAAADKMKAAAQEAGQPVAVRQALDAKHTALIEKLKSADGKAFDKMYVDAQLSAHKDAVQLFESYAKQGDSKPLAQFAQQTLPTLKEHRQHVEKLESSQSS